MRRRILFEDRAQDQRRGARLAGAGRAEHGEVLAEQLVDADHCRDRAVLPDGADTHRCAVAAAESNFKFSLHGDADAITESGVNGDAAIEKRAPGIGGLQQLADETELRDPDFVVAFALRWHRHAQGRDDREHGGIGGVDREQSSHFRAVGERTNAGLAGRIEQHDRLRSRHGHDAADGRIQRAAFVLLTAHALHLGSILRRSNHGHSPFRSSLQR